MAQSSFDTASAQMVVFDHIAFVVERRTSRCTCTYKLCICLWHKPCRDTRCPLHLVPLSFGFYLSSVLLAIVEDQIRLRTAVLEAAALTPHTAWYIFTCTICCSPVCNGRCCSVTQLLWRQTITRNSTITGKAFLACPRKTS